MAKKAIHFGVETSGGGEESAFFNRVKDAAFYHQLSLKKGFDSRLITSDDDVIDSSVIKHWIRKVTDQNESAMYFISISGNSKPVSPRWGAQTRTDFNKEIVLENNQVFGKEDLHECLSLFSSGDTVFFLVSDLQVNGSGSKSSLWTYLKPSKRVKAKAAVLSLTRKQNGHEHEGGTCLSNDVDFVFTSARSIADLRSNLEALHGDKSVVKPELFCYNLAEENDFFLYNQ